jgi:DNA processing protein
VPGQIDNLKARGPHKLLRQGARLVESIDDVLDELGPLPMSVKTEEAGEVGHGQVLRLNEREQAVYAVLDSSPKELDEIAGATGLSAQELSSTLTVLELKQMVCKLVGGRFVRKR